MFERIMLFIACLICSLPFFIIAICMKNSEPINFWSYHFRDRLLDEENTNISEYNIKIDSLFKKVAILLCIRGIAYLLNIKLGIIILCFVIYILYKVIKILKGL